MITLADLHMTLGRYRYRWKDEKQLQDGIEVALRSEGIEASREVRLDPESVIDFTIGRIGIEVKIAGSPASILGQIMRYAGSGKLDGILLVTRKAQHDGRIPPSIAGIPVAVLVVGGFW